jgi:hypothetical protein
VSRELFFVGSRGRAKNRSAAAPSSAFSGRRSGRGMIAALVKNKYRGNK